MCPKNKVDISKNTVLCILDIVYFSDNHYFMFSDISACHYFSLKHLSKSCKVLFTNLMSHKIHTVFMSSPTINKKKKARVKAQDEYLHYKKYCPSISYNTISTIQHTGDHTHTCTVWSMELECTAKSLQTIQVDCN